MKGHINTFSDGEQEGSPSGPPAEIPVGTELSCAGLGPVRVIGEPREFSVGFWVQPAVIRNGGQKTELAVHLLVDALERKEG